MLVDLKNAVRALRRGAGPLVVGVLSLSLGIAATATMLSVIDAIDFRPIPFRSADELVSFSEVDTARPDLTAPVSPGIYQDWKRRTRSTAALAAASSIVVALEDDNEGLDAARVSAHFFSTLGVQPVAGRLLDASDVLQQARVAVVSHSLWRTRFGGDEKVIGRTVPLSWAGEYRSVPAEPYIIVGVLPRAVRYPVSSQVWIPAAEGFGDSRRGSYLTVIGRLRHDVSLEAARAEFELISAQLANDLPEEYGRRVAGVTTLRDAMRRAVESRGAGARVPLLRHCGIRTLPRCAERGEPPPRAHGGSGTGAKTEARPGGTSRAAHHGPSNAKPSRFFGRRHRRDHPLTLVPAAGLL